MTVVPLAADERLLAAYARYDRSWATGDDAAVVPARLDLCQALLDCGETLAPEVLAQMHRDKASVDRQEAVTV